MPFSSFFFRVYCLYIDFSFRCMWTVEKLIDELHHNVFFSFFFSVNEIPNGPF